MLYAMCASQPSARAIRTRDRRIAFYRPAWPIALLLLCLCLGQTARAAHIQEPTTQVLQQLADAQQWPQIVALLERVHPRDAEMDFFYGSALAHMGRYADAERALRSGRRAAPADSRFPVELAGIAFRQKKYPQAASLLRAAVRLNPRDSYANDFLATVYFLEGNLEAALKYWNRVGKPMIESIQMEPQPRVSPALLDHAFAFSPAGTLRLQDLLTTQARIRGLGIFPQYHFDLTARNDGRFDVQFRNWERNGFGESRWAALFLFLRELPFQGVDPEYYNVRRQAINFVSMVRWDAQKRRILAHFSGPFEHGAKYRYDFVTDLRNENWVLRNSFAGPVPALASFNTRYGFIGFDLASFASGRVRWSAGAQLSHRDFRNVNAGTVLTPQMLAAGYQLKQVADASVSLWRLPERRLSIDAQAASQAARLWSQHGEAFEKLTGSLNTHWFPRAEGDDYETQQILRTGKTFGQVPFDELFMLGLERDNDLPMRAHIGTRDGRKGSAPMGRNYFLVSWETDKNLYSNGLMTLKLGPFLDSGKITDPSTSLGSYKWLWDTGVETKLRVFGSTVAFSYGKDLRSGNNAFYVTLLP